MRYVVRVDEKEIKEVLSKAFSQPEDKIDIYVDADNQVVAEVEVQEVTIEGLMNDGSTTN